MEFASVGSTSTPHEMRQRLALIQKSKRPVWYGLRCPGRRAGDASPPGNLSPCAVSNAVRTRATLTSLRARRRSLVQEARERTAPQIPTILAAFFREWRCAMSLESAKVSRADLGSLQ